MDNKQAGSGKKAGEIREGRPQKSDKEKRLELALRDNLVRRKEAQKSRPHRKNLPANS